MSISGAVAERPHHVGDLPVEVRDALDRIRDKFGSDEAIADSPAAVARAALAFCSHHRLKNQPRALNGFAHILHSLQSPIGASSIECLMRIALLRPNGDLSALRPLVKILGSEIRTEHFLVIECFLASNPRFPDYALKEILPQAVVEHRSHPILRRWAPAGIVISAKGVVGSILATLVFGPSAIAEATTLGSIVLGAGIWIGARIPGKWWPQRVRGEDLTRMFNGFQRLSEGMPPVDACPFPAIRPGLAHILIENPEWFSDAIRKRAGLRPEHRALPGIGLLWSRSDRVSFIEFAALILRVSRHQDAPGCQENVS